MGVFSFLFGKAPAAIPHDTGSNSYVIERGYKGFPRDDGGCECYPEGRNDCDRARECREMLGYKEPEGGWTDLPPPKPPRPA